MKQGDWPRNPQLQETNGECVVFLKRRDLTGATVSKGSDNSTSIRFSFQCINMISRLDHCSNDHNAYFKLLSSISSSFSPDCFGSFELRENWGFLTENNQFRMK